ncbi:metallophosphoesterase [Chryseobacterium tongliaoense]|uniref:metallophosphoesterase n=1 Tax=Chryseobacterium tongliaoense TaxID=3240933 RepID=UPI0035121319
MKKKIFCACMAFVLMISCQNSYLDPTASETETEINAKQMKLATETQLLPPNSSWKYLDNGSNQGTAWRTSAFNDTGWATGTGQLGFGDGDEATVLQSGYITYYFRKHINIADVNALPNSLILSMIHDDGAVVYVNGTEVLRTALLPQSGTIAYTTGTSTYIPTAQENNYFDYQISKSYFQTGDNVIAIEVHNQNTGSSDLSFDCKITESAQQDPDGPYVFFRNNNYIVKSIDRTQGFTSQTFATRSQVALTVQLPDGNSFPVSLQPQLTVREQAEYPTLPAKYFATSDIEGGIMGFILMLRKAGIIDSNYNWSYGNSHLFIMGDVFDRGQYVSQCLWLIYKLEQEAAAAGGKVHFILGNHDIMNLIGDFRYVHAKYTDNVPVLGETLTTLYDANSELGKWLRSKNVIERAGNTIFLHAGVSPEVAALNQSVTTLNNYVNPVINKTCTSADCKTATGSTYGLYWYRGMANQTLTQTQVNSILTSLSAERAFIGHTILNNQITLLYQTKVVDLDLSHAENFLQGYMEGVYYNGCYFKFHTTSSQTTYTPLIGSNCVQP